MFLINEKLPFSCIKEQTEQRILYQYSCSQRPQWTHGRGLTKTHESGLRSWWIIAEPGALMNARLKDCNASWMSHSCPETRMSVRKHQHDVHTLTVCKSLLNKTWRGFVRRRHLNMWFEDEFFVACRVFEFSFGSMSGILSERSADVWPSAKNSSFLYSKKYFSIFFF